MLVLLLLHAAASVAHAAGGAVPAASVEEPAPFTWAATDARYTVTIPADGPLRLTLEWRFTSAGTGWAELPLAGPDFVVHRASAPVLRGPGGTYVLLGPGSPDRIRLEGTLDRAGPGAASLPVLPAARQRVIVDAPGLDVTVAKSMGGWLAAADRLALTWAPHVDAAPRPVQPVVHAEAATAVWAEPGALISRTVARWKVVRGTVDRFELDVAGLEEVDAEGPLLARATRSGDRLVLIPRAPVRGTFEVRVRARRAVSGDAELAGPAPRPLASRVDRWWTVGRAEDGELVPLGGPRAVPSRDVPTWARGLSDTPVVSSWQGDAALRVRLADYTPLMGPDTVIERAVLVVASAVEGRSLVRTTWHVRNERKQYLHVTPPPGMRAMTARVSGEPVALLTDGERGFYVPLEKSVETVQGLLTFPVELTWIAEGEAWERKGERAFALPAVDAPIQAAEWEVYLPRGVTSNRATTVSAAPAPPEEAGADELQAAVDAYKRNDFASSNAYLQRARASGSTNANVDRLQSNLDALFDEAAIPDDVATRRVRDLANAKTVTLQVEQEKKAEEARRAYQRGDVDEAEAYLEEVIALADDIGVTEQKESAEQEGKKQAAVELLKQVKVAKAKSAERERPASSTATTKDLPRRPPEPAVQTVVGGERDTEEDIVADELEPATDEVPGEPNIALDFEDIELDGGAVRPTAAEPVHAGRTFSEVVTTVSGVVARGGKGRAKPARDAQDGREAANRGPVALPKPVAAPPPAARPPAADTAADVPAADPPPAEPEQRAALEVKAAPLTLAMPLSGVVVRSTAALLPAGATPTLTVPYRTTR